MVARRIAARLFAALPGTPALNETVYLLDPGALLDQLLHSRSLSYPGNQLGQYDAVQLNGRTKTALVVEMRVIMLTFLCYNGILWIVGFAPSNISSW